MWPVVRSVTCLKWQCTMALSPVKTAPANTFIYYREIVGGVVRTRSAGEASPRQAKERAGAPAVVGRFTASCPNEVAGLRNPAPRTHDIG